MALCCIWIILRSDESSDIASIDGDCSLLDCVSEISFSYNEITRCLIDIGYCSNVVRVSGVVSDSGVFPVVQYTFAQFRNVCVVLFPHSHRFRSLDQIIATNLDRHDWSIFESNCQCGPCTRTPSPSVFHFCVSRKCSGEAVVNINNTLVRAVCFFLADPTFHQIDNCLSWIHFLFFLSWICLFVCDILLYPADATLVPALELLVPDLIVVACVLLIEQEGCEDRVRCVRLRCSSEDSLHWS